jgi:hypothetical protein
MKQWPRDPVQARIYQALLVELKRSRYAGSDRELQKAWAIVWLVKQLADEHSGSWELKQKLKKILGDR